MDNLIELAELHATRLQQDINYASTRAEHVRVTARANEARALVNILKGEGGQTDGFS